MAPALITRGGVGWRRADLFPDRHGFTVMVGIGRPLSRGHVLLRSNDPAAHPRIFPGYFSEPEDLRALARSVRCIREMMRGPAIRDLIEAELAARAARRRRLDHAGRTQYLIPAPTRQPL